MYVARKHEVLFIHKQQWSAIRMLSVAMQTFKHFKGCSCPISQLPSTDQGLTTSFDSRSARQLRSNQLPNFNVFCNTSPIA